MAKKEQKKKKNETELEPQYYLSATNMQTLNYKVYYMKPMEKLAYRILAFAVGFAVGFLFYGGIGKDEFDQPTLLTHILNILIPSVVGLICARFIIPIRTNQIIVNRRKKLNSQFRDMLEALSTAIGAGKNVPEAFMAANEDLRVQYAEGSFILNELEIILSGINNNVAIEDILDDFGKRSGIQDIVSFASVFRTCYRKGGNIKDVIRNTTTILSDKMEIREEIESIVSSNKMEQYIMVIIPVGLIAMIKMMSPELGKNFVSGSGIISTTVAIVLFVAAFWLGKQMLDIKI